MRRVLCHELAHLMAWEVTGSRKRLGDGNRERRIPTWLDEGFAEVASLLALDCEPRLRKLAADDEDAVGDLSLRELDAVLDDVTSPLRPAAFGRAIAQVLAYVDARGLRNALETVAASGAQRIATWAPK